MIGMVHTWISWDGTTRRLWLRISERELRLADAEGKYDVHVLGCFVQSRPVPPSWNNLDSIETCKYLGRPGTVHRWHWYLLPPVSSCLMI
jgi:hypothetical protein